MSKFRWLLLGSIVVVSTLAFAACGGGDDDDGEDDGDNTPAASETTSSGGDETVEAEPTEEEDDSEGSGGNGEGDKDELIALGEAFLESTFQATYEVTSVGDAGAGITGITIFKSGEDLRFDITGETEGQPIDAAFITAGETSYLCFTGDFVQTLGFEGEGVCTESAADDPSNPVGSLTDEFEITEEDLADTEILGREEREIAGQDAICYQTSSPESGESTVCMSEDGVLLAVESADTNFTATEVSDEVSDSDFEPPYPVEELPF